MTPRLRAVLAGVLLLAVTVGLPLALAGTVGNPLHAWPSLRAGQLSDADLTAILAGVFYLAWISFVVPVGIELILTVRCRLTRRPYRDVRLPLLGAQHDLARHLIAAVLMVTPAASVTAAAASPASTMPSAAAQPAAVSAALHSDTGPQRTPRPPSPDSAPDVSGYVIPETGGMRSYWALAEHYLGDGARWREIWQLNAGRVHPDGVVMDTPRRLFAGWTVLIPPDHAGAVSHAQRSPQTTVHHGDTLSGIAAAHGESWQELWATNRGHREGDGTRLTDPDMLRPGWTISLPTEPHTPTPPAHRPTHRRQPPAAAPAQPPPHAATPPTPADTTPATPSAPASAASPPAPHPTAPRGRNGTSIPAPTTTTRNDHDLPVSLLVALGAAGAVTLLDRYRRIAQRRRRIGHRPLPPPPDLLSAEAALRREARAAQPTVAAVALAAALTAEQPVTVLAVTARHDGAVDLQLAGPAPTPPPPFVAITGGWRLPTETSAFAYALDDLDDPHPALIPIGATVDGHVLVDLAATGPVSITGDPDTVERYLTAMVSAVHAAPWSQRVQLHLPPRAAEQVGPLERLSVEDSIRPRLPAPPQPVPAPVDAAEEPGWRTTPVHLYVGWTADADIGPVVDAGSDPARNIHILITGAHRAATTWTLDGDQLTVPYLSDPVTVTLPDPTAPGAAELIAHTAAAPDVPVGDPRLPDLTDAATVPASTNANADGPSTTGGPRRLLLLGPVELTGTGRLRRSQILNVLTFLALHRRGVDRHQILAALWPDQSPSLQTLRNRLRETRALVDGAISDGPIWILDDTVTTDWQEFTALAAGSVEDQHNALRLIRGRPFDGLDDADWIDLGGFRSEIEAAVVDLAVTVSERDLAAGDYPAALAAARAGLQASRYEERLHRIAIRAALAQNLNGLARTLQREMRTALDIDIEPDDQMQPQSATLARQIADRHPVGTPTGQR